MRPAMRPPAASAVATSPWVFGQAVAASSPNGEVLYRVAAHAQLTLRAPSDGGRLVVSRAPREEALAVESRLPWMPIGMAAIGLVFLVVGFLA